MALTHSLPLCRCFASAIRRPGEVDDGYPGRTWKLPSVRRSPRVRSATEQAIGEASPGVPTVAIGDERFWGDDRLQDAAAALNRTGTV